MPEAMEIWSCLVSVGVNYLVHVPGPCDRLCRILWFWSASTLLNIFRAEWERYWEDTLSCERAVYYPSQRPGGVFTAAMLSCVLWKVMMTEGTGTLLCLPCISDTLITAKTNWSLCSLAIVGCCPIKPCEWLSVSMFTYRSGRQFQLSAARWQSYLVSSSLIWTWWQFLNTPNSPK